MNIDCLRHVLLHCDIKDILTLDSVNKDFNNIIHNDNFWKLLMLRDFEDINKLSNEKWIDYYKRRSTNYGIPVIINDDIYQYNKVKQFISFLGDKGRKNLVLTKDNELYIINNDGFLKINHNVKIKKVYGFENFYFVDDHNFLYKIESDKLSFLGINNVSNLAIDRYTSDIYYSDKHFTYYINNGINQKILNFKAIDFLNIQNIDYIINEENYLLLGKTVNKKYEIKSYDMKASQLSCINNKIVLVLGLDGFVLICNDYRFRRIKVPNVSMLGYNSFLTKNGDLYYFDKTYKEILIDIDVVHVSYVTDDGEDGCYIKRNKI